MVVLAKTREDANVKRNNDDDGDNAALTRGRGARDLDPRPADKQESARALFVRCTAPETAQSSGNARASAYIEVGGENRLMGVVHGPRRGQGGASSSTLRVELTYAPFSGGGGTSAREQEISSRVHDVVGAAVLASELAEKGLVVDLHVLVMSSGGGDLAHAITCASLALANALVPMRDVITAAHVGLRAGRLVLDPSIAETTECEASVTVAALPATGELAGVFVEGHLGESMSKAMQLAMAACKQTRIAVRAALVESRDPQTAALSSMTDVDMAVHHDDNAAPAMGDDDDGVTRAMSLFLCNFEQTRRDTERQ